MRHTKSVTANIARQDTISQVLRQIKVSDITIRQRKHGLGGLPVNTKNLFKFKINHLTDKEAQDLARYNGHTIIVLARIDSKGIYRSSLHDATDLSIHNIKKLIVEEFNTRKCYTMDEYAQIGMGGEL